MKMVVHTQSQVTGNNSPNRRPVIFDVVAHYRIGPTLPESFQAKYHINASMAHCVNAPASGIAAGHNVRKINRVICEANKLGNEFRSNQPGRKRE